MYEVDVKTTMKFKPSYKMFLKKPQAVLCTLEGIIILKTKLKL